MTITSTDTREDTSAATDDNRQLLARGLNDVFATLVHEQHGTYVHDDRSPGATWRALKLAEQLDGLGVDWIPEDSELQVVVSGQTRTQPPVLVRLVVWPPNRPPWTEITVQWHSNPLEMLRRMWRQTKWEAL